MHRVGPEGDEAFELPCALDFRFSSRILGSYAFNFIHHLLWHWVVTAVSVPCGLTHVTVLSCQNYLETTNYEVLKNLEGFSLAFTPFHTKDPDPRRQHCTLYEHRAVMTFSLCAGCFKVTVFF